MNIMGEATKIEDGAKTKDSGVKIPPKMRQIIIETNGDDIHLVSAEVSGRIELIAILQGLIAFLSQPTK